VRMPGGRKGLGSVVKGQEAVSMRDALGAKCVHVGSCVVEWADRGTHYCFVPVQHHMLSTELADTHLEGWGPNTTATCIEDYLEPRPPHLHPCCPVSPPPPPPSHLPPSPTSPPASLLAWATTGAAPVPVPPPMPAVTNTCSSGS
jgi:hypothetical protein